MSNNTTDERTQALRNRVRTSFSVFLFAFWALFLYTCMSVRNEGRRVTTTSSPVYEPPTETVSKENEKNSSSSSGSEPTEGNRFHGRRENSTSSSGSEPPEETISNENEKKVRYFGVGINKSGTTSLEKAFQELGLRTASQAKYEALFPLWEKRQWQDFVDHVRKDESDAFQDNPFANDFTFQALDMAFPGSKFILTQRSSSDIWFESIRNFHGKLFNGTKLSETKWNSATLSDIKRASYRYPGYVYHVLKSGFFLPDDDKAASKLLYDKDHFIGIYERHNMVVKQYFWNRPGDLLVLNVEEDGAMEQLCNFVGKSCPGKRFPHQNPTVRS